MQLFVWSLRLIGEIVQYLLKKTRNVIHLKDINKKFEKISSPEKIIITTEKDAVRLLKYTDQLLNIPLYILPIRHHFLFNQANEFNQLVFEFISGFKKENTDET